MARVTVEDCVDKVPNRFELVLLASHRARALHNGNEATVPIDNDKSPVIALREIAEESLFVDDIKEDYIKSLQLYQEDENVDDLPPSSNEEKNAEVKPIDSEIKDQEEVIFENIEKQDLENNPNLNTVSDNSDDDSSEVKSDDFNKEDEPPIEENQL